MHSWSASAKAAWIPACASPVKICQETADLPTPAEPVSHRTGTSPTGTDSPSALNYGASSASGPALFHPARELVHVEIVPPGVDLAAADLEGAHDRQLERLVGELEDVNPLRHHDRTIGRDVDDAEIDALDAWRARADERGDVVGDGVPTGDGSERDVVVNGVLGEECGQLDCSHVVGPRGAKPAHHLDWAFHLAPPVLGRIGYPPQTVL